MSEFVTEFSTPATSQCNIIIPSVDLSTLLMLNNKKEHVILVLSSITKLYTFWVNKVNCNTLYSSAHFSGQISIPVLPRNKIHVRFSLCKTC